MGGTQKRTSKKFNVDSMPIGKCDAGQAINKCTGGGNAWGKFNHKGGWCSKGKNIGVTVTCKAAKPKPTPKPVAKVCPVEGGFCVKWNNQDQNSGVFKLSNANVKTAKDKAKCLKLSQDYKKKKATGCEA